MKFFYLLIMEIGFYSVLFSSLWILEKFKTLLEQTIRKAKANKNVLNDLYSCIYFLIDMGPNVSAYSVVALVVNTNDSFFQLLIVFALGILMKRAGRRLAKNLAQLTGER